MTAYWIKLVALGCMLLASTPAANCCARTTTKPTGLLGLLPIAAAVDGSAPAAPSSCCGGGACARPMSQAADPFGAVHGRSNHGPVRTTVPVIPGVRCCCAPHALPAGERPTPETQDASRPLYPQAVPARAPVGDPFSARRVSWVLTLESGGSSLARPIHVLNCVWRC